MHRFAGRNDQQERKEDLSESQGTSEGFLMSKSRLSLLLLDKYTVKVAEEKRASVRVDQAWTQARLPERPKLGFMKLVLREPDRREPIGDVPMMLSSSTVWPSTAKRCRMSSVTFWKLAVSCSS